MHKPPSKNKTLDIIYSEEEPDDFQTRGGEGGEGILKGFPMHYMVVLAECCLMSMLDYTMHQIAYHPTLFQERQSMCLVV